MNPFIVTVVGSILRLKRICPKCKREQIVPFAKKRETVPCKFCGTPVPPAKASAGDG